MIRSRDDSQVRTVLSTEQVLLLVKKRREVSHDGGDEQKCKKMYCTSTTCVWNRQESVHIISYTLFDCRVPGKMCCKMGSSLESRETLLYYIEMRFDCAHYSISLQTRRMIVSYRYVHINPNTETSATS
jgi:hypothetical protein